MKKDEYIFFIPLTFYKVEVRLRFGKTQIKFGLH